MPWNSPLTDAQERRPLKIISGGQTGVDRAALDAAIELGISHGGWCPKGRRAEDGVIPDKYQLDELDTTRYAARTRRNVTDSDGTLILLAGLLRGGTKLTHDFATANEKPVRLVRLRRDTGGQQDVDEVRRWIERHNLRVLNVAGPRESQRFGVYTLAKAFLVSLFRDLPNPPDRG